MKINNPTASSFVYAKTLCVGVKFLITGQRIVIGAIIKNFSVLFMRPAAFYILKNITRVLPFLFCIRFLFVFLLFFARVTERNNSASSSISINALARRREL